MDQRENQLREDIEDTRVAITEKIETIENRVHQTMDGTKSTIDTVMNNIKSVQGTVEHTESTIDSIIGTIKQSMDEATERAKYAADLMEQVNKNPWIMFSCAVLTGYALSSIDRGRSVDSQHH
jgi:archaellum component FlaC